MSFLKCLPTVFVIEDRYEIAISLIENGVCGVRIGDTVYREENSGVLSSEKNYLRIPVPMKVLDREKKYEIIYRKTILRKAYKSELSEEESETFEFKPITKTEGVKIYHIADAHHAFESAKNAAKYFGDETDLFVVNGDIDEPESYERIFSVVELCGSISRGRVPVVYSRGNHDTRGRYAEEIATFFPNVNKQFFFTFEIGNIFGIVLDLGEDKLDCLPNYGGVNAFHEYRIKETEFLKNLKAPKGKTVIAISHVPPSLFSEYKNTEFDIERDTYTCWINELERLGVRFMLSGHDHRQFILMPNAERSLHKHNYPIIVGSYYESLKNKGAALELYKDKVNVKFTDDECRLESEETVEFS